MRIGIDARYAFRTERRGIGTYIYNLLAAISRLEGAPEFILYTDEHGQRPPVELFPREQFHWRPLKAANFALWEQAALPYAAARDGADLLHCPANIAPVFSRCPLVLSLHDVIEWRRRQFDPSPLSLRHRISRAYRMPIMAAGARRARAVITDSEFSRQDIHQVLGVPLSHIHVTHLAHDVELSPATPAQVQTVRAKYGLDQRYFFALGAADHRKNVAGLLEGYRHLRRTMASPPQLVLAGFEVTPGGEVEGVQCLPFVPREELAAFYTGATAFVYPSFYEGFGLPPLEAMACGTPVISSSASSLPEVCGDAALFFDPAEPAQLAGQILRVLQEPACADRLREAGNDQVLRYSWERCARETLSIYEAGR